MNIYTIYKITNQINNKCYIGFTNNPKRRKYNHFRANGNQILYKAIRKYGVNNFIFEEIYQSKDKNHTLTVMETYFIKMFDSFKNGYNMTLGGNGGSMIDKKHSAATKEKMRKSQLGKINSKVHRKNISIALTGKSLSKKHKDNIRKGITLHKYIIYFLDGTTHICENLNMFAKENNYSVGSLSLVYNNKQKFHKNIIKIDRIKT